VAIGGDGPRNALTGAGTIFYGKTDGVTGTVVVDNQYRSQSWYSVFATHLPANRVEDQSENLRRTDWLVTRQGYVSLQTNVKIHAFTLDGPAAALNLNGHTLTLIQFTDRDGVVFKRPGVYADNAAGAFDNVDFSQGGAIEITPSATLFIVR